MDTAAFLLIVVSFLCGFITHMMIVSEDLLKTLIPFNESKRNRETSSTNVVYQRGGGSAVSAPSIEFDTDTSISSCPAAKTKKSPSRHSTKTALSLTDPSDTGMETALSSPTVDPIRDIKKIHPGLLPPMSPINRK